MTTPLEQTILVMTHVPDRECATRIAEYLVHHKLAACVNFLPDGRSVFRWQGKVESAEEIAVQIKSIYSRYPAIEAAIRELHPYELPEITYVHVDGGEVAYIQWIQQESQA